MDQSRFIRGLLSDPADPQQPQYVPENDFGPRAYGLLNDIFPDPNVSVGDAIHQYRAGDALGAFETMFGAMPTTGALNAARGRFGGAVMSPVDELYHGSPGSAKPPGVIAYHGSPHSFDRFDMSKIGTGEGAQAYGHGLYFAENEAVAKEYRDRLLANKGEAQGLRVGNTPVEDLYSRIDQRAASLPIDRASAEYDKLQALEALMQHGDVSGARAAINTGQVSPEAAAWFEREIAPKFARNGSMYQVRINADPEHFLDWDKPLSEQSPIVRQRLGWTPDAEARYRAAQSADDDALLAALEGDGSYTQTKIPVPQGLPPLSATGADIARGNSVFDSASDAEKAARLREAGIPGIKYLDGGSRAAGDGSRNYVVFDDGLIDILKKYGLVGLLGGGAAMNSRPSNAQQGAPGL